MMRTAKLLIQKSGEWLRGLVGPLGRFERGEKSSISPLFALALVPLIAAIGMAVEASNWWLVQRAAQNAADSAVLAAATNGISNGTSGPACTTLGDWCSEARAVAGKYGFANAPAGTVVTPLANQPCPAPLATSDCYKVTITRDVPVILLRIVGYRGTGGTGFQSIKAVAMAYPTPGEAPPFCIVALSYSATKDLIINGGPNSVLPGCAVASNGSVDCHGHPIGGTIASYAAPGDTNDCAANGENYPLKAAITDPYTSQAALIPRTTCASYGTASNPTPIPAGFKGGGVQVFCGYTQLATVTTGKTGPVVTCHTTPVTLDPGTILVIVNGTLDICADTLNGDGVTIIFTGNPGGPINSNFIAGTGLVNISAPKGKWEGATSNWTGFALYQDPDIARVPANSITFPGSSPTFQINGLVYAPNADIRISGVIGAANACIGFLSNTFRIDGTGRVIDEPDCMAINMDGQPFLAGRAALVQ